jgi:hypothetical protein
LKRLGRGGSVGFVAAASVVSDAGGSGVDILYLEKGNFTRLKKDL